MHPVGAADIDLIVTTISEIKDPAMFEKAADDISYADSFRHSGNAGTQDANAADDQLDRHTCLRCFVKFADEAGVSQSIYFGDDVRRPARLLMSNLAINQRSHLLAHVH